MAIVTGVMMEQQWSALNLLPIAQANYGQSNAVGTAAAAASPVFNEMDSYFRVKFLKLVTDEFMGNSLFA